MEKQMPVPESKNFSAEEMEPAFMRVLDEFGDVSGFLSLKKFFIRFFDDSKKTTFTLKRYIHFWDNTDLNADKTDLPRECYEIILFYNLMGHHMTQDEKLRHVVPLVDMLECLVRRRHRGLFNDSCCCSKELYDCIIRLVSLCIMQCRKIEHTSGETVQLMTNVLETFFETNRFWRGTITENLGDFLLLIYPSDEDWIDSNDVDYLLTCFSDERFHAYDVRNTDTLMNTLPETVVDENLSVVLIRHGFKYSFQEEYYALCCLKLENMGAVYDRPLMQAFKTSGNLRKQMAAEILVILLLRADEVNPELLCTLWQSRPDPFFTPDELYHLMKLFIQTSILVDVCARYRNLIPGVPTVNQPRSLKHLARVLIRESMVQAHSIGEKAVRSLGIPKTLEDYMWNLEPF